MCLRFADQLRRAFSLGVVPMSSNRTVKPQNFVITRRPRLAEITEHPKMDFADYERRLTSLQGELQLIQQAYLGTSRAGGARP